MASNSGQHSRRGWRFIIGLSLLGFLIIASASHAGNRSFPTKNLPLMAGYADLGNTAMKPEQHGWHLSLQGGF